ncbi:hypothetical protein ACFE04_012593 [Oxalis oulophora]
MASISTPSAFFSTTNSNFFSKQKLSTTKKNENFTWKNNEVTRKKKFGGELVNLRASLTELAPKSLTRQVADQYRQGMDIDGGSGYRQVFVVRQFEVGSDKNATIECILNQLQETAINHLRVSGVVGEEFGVSPGMLKHNLIWIVSKLTLEIDDYPCWDDVLEVDTWLRPYGKIGVQKDWTIRNLITGKVHARARSFCMMMNEKTRRLSKIPEEVRDEISQIFHEKKETKPFTIEKMDKLIDAKYKKVNLKPKRSDLDMNKHVNNVKYANWMLEVNNENLLCSKSWNLVPTDAIPEQVSKDYQLSTITLEYKRECGISETIQSLCQPDKDNEMTEGDNSIHSSLRFTHLLEVEGVKKNEETIRGRTTWTRRNT